jgi:1-acyl-sn-glycerol-3-phosphate acyltransferase
MISAIRLFFLVFWTLFMMLVIPIFIIPTFNRYFPLMVARTVFAPVLMWIAGIKLKSYGKENVPKNKPIIFIANHCSHLDIACLCGCLPVNLHFIGKKELAWMPIVGWYMFVVDHIFIDRSNRKKAAESINKAAIKIKNGKSVVLYPEGTRSKTGGLGIFKKGAFHLALMANVDIIPVHIQGTFEVWSTNSFKITPGNVTVRIGKPIDTSKYKGSITELTNDAREAILDMGKE